MWTTTSFLFCPRAALNPVVGQTNTQTGRFKAFDHPQCAFGLLWGHIVRTPGPSHNRQGPNPTWPSLLTALTLLGPVPLGSRATGPKPLHATTRSSEKKKHFRLKRVHPKNGFIQQSMRPIFIRNQFRSFLGERREEGKEGGLIGYPLPTSSGFPTTELPPQKKCKIKQVLGACSSFW